MNSHAAAQRVVRLPDVQARADDRALPLDAVGVKAVRHPITIRGHTRLMPTIATFAMTVALPAVAKGTHMSRFIELLNRQSEPLDQQGFRSMVLSMVTRLGASAGTLEARFPYFARKAAPVSSVQSELDYDVCWRGCIAEQGDYTFHMRVIVPATSLCPCSKEISAYGAHNQRSLITIDAELTGDLPIEDLIAVAERSASCEIYGLLKRPDEKYVTERAYENPKFAEDLVRDVAIELNRDSRVRAYVVEAENFESIHNHSAFARLVHSPSDPRMSR